MVNSGNAGYLISNPGHSRVDFVNDTSLYIDVYGSYMRIYVYIVMYTCDCRNPWMRRRAVNVSGFFFFFWGTRVGAFSKSRQELNEKKFCIYVCTKIIYESIYILVFVIVILYKFLLLSWENVGYNCNSEKNFRNFLVFFDWLYFGEK